MEARLAKWEALREDEHAVHVNILRGTLPLDRMNALHIAGATDYDTIKAQLAAEDAEIERLKADNLAAFERGMALNKAFHDVAVKQRDEAQSDRRLLSEECRRLRDENERLQHELDADEPNTVSRPDSDIPCRNEPEEAGP